MCRESFYCEFLPDPEVETLAIALLKQRDPRLQPRISTFGDADPAELTGMNATCHIDVQSVDEKDTGLVDVRTFLLEALKNALPDFDIIDATRAPNVVVDKNDPFKLHPVQLTAKTIRVSALRVRQH